MYVGHEWEIILVIAVIVFILLVIGLAAWIVRAVWSGARAANRKDNP